MSTIQISVNTFISPLCPTHNPQVPQLSLAFGTNPDDASEHYTLEHREIEQKLLSVGFDKVTWTLVGNGDGDAVLVNIPEGDTIEKYLTTLKSVSEECYIATSSTTWAFLCKGHVNREAMHCHDNPCCDKMDLS